MAKAARAINRLAPPLMLHPPKRLPYLVSNNEVSGFVEDQIATIFEVRFRLMPYGGQGIRVVVLGGTSC